MGKEKKHGGSRRPCRTNRPNALSQNGDRYDCRYGVGHCFDFYRASKLQSSKLSKTQKFSKFVYFEKRKSTPNAGENKVWQKKFNLEGLNENGYFRARVCVCVRAAYCYICLKDCMPLPVFIIDSTAASGQLTPGSPTLSVSLRTAGASKQLV